MLSSLSNMTSLTGALSHAKSSMVSVGSACVAVQRACLPSCVMNAELATLDFAAASFTGSAAGRSFRKVEGAVQWGVNSVEGSLQSVKELEKTQAVEEQLSAAKMRDEELNASFSPKYGPRESPSTVQGKILVPAPKAVKIAATVKQTAAMSFAKVSDLLGGFKATATRAAKTATATFAGNMAFAKQHLRAASTTAKGAWYRAAAYVWPSSSRRQHILEDVFDKALSFGLGCILWLSLVLAFALTASTLVMV